MASEQEGAEQKEKACMLCGREFPGKVETCPDDGTLLTPLGKEPKVGDIFAGRYEILDTIGGGGMGKVYKARHNLMKRIVAIKMLLPHLVQNAAALKRFTQEAQAASALKHPHILYVHDFGISDQGIPFLIMDYLEGQTLSTVLQDEGALPEARAVPIFIQACSALAHAHAKGVVHRDIKPANIMLINFEGQTDYLQIVDFGIAKLLQPDGAEQLTHTGEVFGSPMYMSPEQCRGKELDARSDIYSLGCVLYRSITGRPVFGGRDAMECMYKQVNDTPATFSEVCPELALSDRLEAAVFKAIAKDPEQRFQSMTEFREALEEVRNIAAPPVSKLFSVPPDSGQVIAYDAVTDQLKRPNLAATQYAGHSEDKSNGASSAANPALSSGQEPAIASSNSGAQAQATSSDSGPQVQASASNSGAQAQATVASDSGAQAQATVASDSGAQAQSSAAADSGAQAQSTAASNSGAQAPASPSPASDSTESGGRPVFSESGQTVSTISGTASQADAGPNKMIFIGGGIALVLAGLMLASLNHGKDSSGPVGSTDTSTSSTTDSGKSTESSSLVSKSATQVASGDFQKAEATLTKAADSAKSDADFIKVLPEQAKVLEQSGKMAQAQEALTKLLAIQQKNGSSAEDIARTKASLALPILQQGNVDQAEPLLNDALKVLQAAPPAQQHGLTHVYYGLSKVAVQKGDYNKAIDYLQEAISRRTKVSGPNDPDLIQYYQDLAEVNMVQGKLAAAEAYLTKVLSICEQKFGKDSAQASDGIKDLATVYFQKGQIEKSETLFKKALEIKTKDFGAESVASAEVMSALAMLYTREKKYKLAEPLFKHSLDIRTRELGADSPQAQRSRELYATLQKRMKGSK